MPVIPFSSAPRIARDAQAAADAREAQAAADERRYREGADAKLKELRANGVKKFNANAEPIGNIPEPVPAGGPRINAPGVETPDPYHTPGGIFSDNYQPQEGDALWNQYESDRTGANADIGYVDLPNQSPDGVGGPDNPIKDPALEAIAQEMIARQKERAGAADEAANRTRALNAPNPDQAAQAQELAGKTGANRLDVLNNLDTYQRVDLAGRLDSLQRQAPKLKTWLDAIPENFEVAHDDVQNLSWWDQATQAFARTDALKAGQTGNKGAGLGALTEMAQAPDVSRGVAIPGIDIVQKIPGALSSGYAMASSGLWGIPRAASELNDQFVSWATGKASRSGVTDFLQRMQDTAQGASKDWMPEEKDPTTRGVLQGFQSLPVSGAAIVAAMMTANPEAGLIVAGGLTGGDAYGTARSQGLSALTSAGYGMGQGLIETATEMLPMHWLVGDIAKQTPFVKMLLRQTLAEVPGEEVATATQDFLDWAILPENANKTINDYIAARPGAAYETLIAAMVGSGIQTTMAKAVDTTLQKVSEGYQQRHAEDLANYIRALGDNAKDSKLLKRLPDKYREAVAAVTKDGPRENIRINPEGIAELAQSQNVTPEQLAQAFRIDPETMVQAMDTGDDIIVPSGNFAAVIQTAKKDIGVSGETIYQALAPHIRLNANDFTARESEAFQKVAKAEADARAEWNTTENDFAASSETVETDIRDQIRATGRFNEDTVDGQAKLMGQLVNVIAKQTGQDPADVWKNDGFNIMSAVTGEQQDEGSSLPQGAELPADATPTQRLIDMRAKGSSNAEIATALYPDVEAKTAVNRVKALASKHKGKIEERKAALEGTATQPAADPTDAAPSSDLASGGNAPNATITLGRTRALIKMFEGANLSSLAHEGAHWYLDLLFRMSKSENPHPFVTAQMARILEFAGKSQEWDGMFNEAGGFTEEGKKLQEQFAEAFEVYLMTGKAPSVGMRSVFNTFKQWILGVYKAFKKGVGQAVRDVGPFTQSRIAAKERELGRRLNDQELVEFVVPQELRDVFDRMLATEDAINAAQTNMVRDSEAMAKAMLEKLDPEGKWKPERQQKFVDRMRDRYAEAKERAEAALMARLMDEYTRARSTVAREEERDIRQEVASEIDEQPAQRVYQVLSGQGWRDTRADHAEDAADEADAMSTLAQWFHSGTIGPQDAIDVTRGELGFHVGSKQSAEIRSRDWPSQQQTISEFDIAGEFTRVPDMGQWGPDDYLEARRRSSVFDENLELMWQELDALAKRDPAMAEWTAAVQDAAKRNGISGWEYKNVQEGGGMSRIVMDPQAIARKPQGELAQSQTHDPKGERELDALGFYSAVFEAAKSVRPDVWSMGWNHARNSIVKGGAKINGQRVAPRDTEMEYLGLDAMFYGTKLKGAELAEAVLSHIQAKRLLLKENFARVDPNSMKTPTKRVMLKEMDDYALADAIGLYLRPMGEGRVSIETDIGEDKSNLYLQRTTEALSGPSYYDLIRYGDGGKREVVANGVEGDLRGQIARIIVDENFAKAERSISAEALAGEWRLSLESKLVRGPGDIRLPGDDVPLFESVIGLPEGVPGSDYQAPRSHVGGKAKGTLVTAHGEERIDDKGQRTLFTGQVQSDMAQQAREDKETAKLGRELRKLLADNPDAQWFKLDDNEQYDVAPYDVSREEAINRANDAFNANVDELRKKYPKTDQELYYQLDAEEQYKWDKLERAWEDAQNMETYGLIARDQVEQRREDAEAFTGVPLLSTSEWTNVGVRAMVYRAARDGFASVSFPTSETSEIIQGNDTAAGHYDTNVKGALEKIGKQLGGEVRLGAVSYEGDMPDVPDTDGNGGRYRVFYAEGDQEVDSSRRYGSLREAEEVAKSVYEAFGDKTYVSLDTSGPDTAKSSAYVLDITPEMRRKIVSEGFPLFQTRTGKDRIAQPASIPAMRLNLDAVREQYGEEAVAALPPAVRAYSTEATDADDFVTQAKAVRQTLNKKHPKSLWKFLSTQRRIGEGNDKISYRGIRDTDGEILKIIGEKKAGPGLIADQEDSKRARSYDIEHAAQVAWEAGYFNTESPPTPTEFLDALRNDFDGQAKLYTPADMPLVDEIKNAEQWAAWFDESGIDITEKDQAVLKAQIEAKLSGTSENAIGPDEAAPFFGMSDGKALLEGLKQGPLRDKLIREETKRRMTERHGDTFSDGTMINEAMAYARNEIQHRQFEIELEALADAAGQRAQANLAKQTAIDNLRSKQVREVLNYNQWLTLSERWGKKAVEAASKGDMAKAMEFARYRLINSHMYSQGKILAEKIEKTRTHLLDYSKKTKQARLFAAGKAYQENMNGLLDDYQFRNETKKGESQRKARGLWIKAQMAGIDPWGAYKDPTKTPAEQQVAAAEQIEKSTLLAELGEGADARNYKSITVEELMAVKDEADLIWRLATLKDRLIKEGERRRIGLAAEDMAASVVANQPKVREPEGLESNLSGEKRKRGVAGVLATHRTLQSLIREMDGGKNGGVVWRYILKPLNAAWSHKSTLMKQAGTDVAKLFEVFSNKEISRFAKDRQTLTLRAKDGSTARVTLTTQGRLAIALNAGNEKNRARLMDSNGWDEAQLQQILDTLDKRSWDWVQSIWDYLNTWFPEANRVHEAVHGAGMDKVASLPVATRFGIYAGGYFPIRFDPNRSSKGGQRALEKDAQAGGAGRIGVRTKEGFTKTRVEGKVTLPLLLDPFMVIMSHLDEVTTSIATEETLFDVGRLAMRSEFHDAVVERHGRARYNEIIEALKAAKFGLQSPRGTIEGIMNHVRNGSTVAKLGWNLKTALLQPAGFSNSAVRIGSTWLLRGYGKMLGSAVKMEGWGKWAIEKSEFMRHRRESQSPEQVNLLATLKGNKPLVVMQRSVYQLMAQTQFFGVDVPTFIGMYDRAIAEGATDEDAVAQAEQAVIDAQGGGEVFQTAGIQRGSVPMRLWTNLMSYMITTYNLSAQRLAQKDPNALAKVTRLTGDMLLLWSVPVAATMFITYVIQQALSGGGGDDDDDYWSAENMAREQLSFLMGPFFGLSQVAGAVKMDPFEYRGPAGGDIITQGYAALDAASHGKPLELLRPANQVAGMIFHLPANQIDKSVRGSLALWNGETDNPAAIFFGPPPK